MNTCGSCKYFGKRIERDDGEEVTAEEIYVPEIYHVCELVEHFEAYQLPKPAPIAIVVDGSGYFAALCVKEEFGCNQWAAIGEIKNDDRG